MKNIIKKKHKNQTRLTCTTILFSKEAK